MTARWRSVWRPCRNLASSSAVSDNGDVELHDAEMKLSKNAEEVNELYKFAVIG